MAVAVAVGGWRRRLEGGEQRRGRRRGGGLKIRSPRSGAAVAIWPLPCCLGTPALPGAAQQGRASRPGGAVTRTRRPAGRCSNPGARISVKLVSEVIYVYIYVCMNVCV